MPLKKKEMKLENITLTDATTGLGGFAFMMMYKVGKLNLVELDKTKMENIKKNIQIYKKYTDVNCDIKFYKNNYLDIYEELSL